MRLNVNDKVEGSLSGSNDGVMMYFTGLYRMVR